jgi:hypothetical protein
MESEAPVVFDLSGSASSGSALLPQSFRCVLFQEKGGENDEPTHPLPLAGCAKPQPLIAAVE